MFRFLQQFCIYFTMFFRFIQKFAPEKIFLFFFEKSCYILTISAFNTYRDRFLSPSNKSIQRMLRPGQAELLCTLTIKQSAFFMHIRYIFLFYINTVAFSVSIWYNVITKQNLHKFFKKEQNFCFFY